MGFNVNLSAMRFKNYECFRPLMSLDDLFREIVSSGREIKYIENINVDLDRVVKCGIPQIPLVKSLNMLNHFPQFPCKNTEHEDMTLEQYNFAKQLYDEMGQESFIEYVARLRCALLANVCEAMRDLSLKIYKLDPFAFYSISSLAFNAAFLWSKGYVEYITDDDMRRLFDISIFGGYQSFSQKFVRANNKTLKSYNPNKECVHILYADIVSSYGHVLEQEIPVDGFEWMEPSELENFDYKNPPTGSGYGFFFLVPHLELDPALHEKFRHMVLTVDKTLCGCW